MSIGKIPTSACPYFLALDSLRSVRQSEMYLTFFFFLPSAAPRDTDWTGLSLACKRRPQRTDEPIDRVSADGVKTEAEWILAGLTTQGWCRRNRLRAFGGLRNP